VVYGRCNKCKTCLFALKTGRLTRRSPLVPSRLSGRFLFRSQSKVLITTAVNVGIALVVAIVFFGLRIPLDRWLALLITGFGVAVAAAGIGLAIGAALRDYRTLQPLLGVLMAGSFFVSGGYASVATLPPAVRTFDMFWPPAYVFETMQAMMHMAVLPDLSSVFIALPLAAGLGVAFGAWMVRRVL